MNANSSSSAIIFLLFTDFFHSNSDIRGRVVAGDTTSCTSRALYSSRSNWWERCFLMALQGIWAKSFTLLGPRRAILTAPETFRQSRPRRRFPRYRPPSKAWLSFHGMSSLYRGKIVPHRCSSKKMKCSDRILLCSLDFFPFFKPTRSNTYLRK